MAEETAEIKVLVYRYTCRKCGYQGINIDKKTCLKCGGRTKNIGQHENIKTMLKEILKELAFLDRKINELSGKRFGGK